MRELRKLEKLIRPEAYCSEPYCNYKAGHSGKHEPEDLTKIASMLITQIYEQLHLFKTKHVFNPVAIILWEGFAEIIKAFHEDVTKECHIPNEIEGLKIAGFPVIVTKL